jgi:hypothetical protein
MKCKILMFASSPADQDQLMLGREAREVRQRLRAARFRDDFSLETRWAVRRQDFVNEVLFEDPDVVHLSGHGNEMGEWLFEGENGFTEPLPSREIETIFETLRGKIKIVLFNGCYADQIALAVTSNVDCAVGFRKSIDDSMAIEFSAAFYSALASDRSVLTSFKHACDFARAEACEPRIYFREGVSGATLRLLPPLTPDSPAASIWTPPAPSSVRAETLKSSLADAVDYDVQTLESGCTLPVGDTAILYVPQDEDGNLAYYRANPQQVALRRIGENEFVLLTHPQPRDPNGNPLPTRFQLRVDESVKFSVNFFLGDKPRFYQFRLTRTRNADLSLTIIKPLL